VLLRLLTILTKILVLQTKNIDTTPAQRAAFQSRDCSPITESYVVSRVASLRGTERIQKQGTLESVRPFTKMILLSRVSTGRSLVLHTTR
jgi:hypothetical protein